MTQHADLHLIDLDQDLPGQRRFISCWVRRSQELTFIVDPGPPSSGDRLIAELEALAIDRLDFVLLTHIHLDHAGTTAAVLDRWPEARVICHPHGRRHLAAPAKLWEGSLAVLGEKAEAYGEPRPVPKEALAEYAEAEARGVRIIETPGHAPHHICFAVGDDLFLGEAAGTFSTLGCGPDTDEPYLRPATPPMFKLEVAQRSLDALLALDPAPRRLLFAHHGMFTGEARGLLQAARDQLGLWVGICREVTERIGGLPPTGDGTAEAAWMDAVAAELRARDPFYARGDRLPEDIRVRERDFTRQSLRGMLGYLRR
ncbi:MAG: MBL fold metallo-hydrolase [Candidatus Krumholzibacteriia bacterium]